MLTVSEDAEDLMDTLRAGAAGLPAEEHRHRISCRRDAARGAGESVMSPRDDRQAGGGPARRPAAPAPLRRKTDSVRASAKSSSCSRAGASNKEIARDFELAESTVKIHVQNILRKLNLTSRVQAAVYAVEHGLSEK